MALADEDRRKVDALFDAMDAEPEKLAPAAARALADYTGCAAAASTPRADDLCIAHFEVVQVGRYSAAVLAVTSAGGVRTRVARVDTGLSRKRRGPAGPAAEPEPDLCLAGGPDPHAFRQPAHGGGGKAVAGGGGGRGTGSAPAPQVYLEGAQYLAQKQDVRQNLGELLEIFSDTEAATELIEPEGGRVTAKLGDDFDPAMPNLCVVCKRYLAGGGLTGSMALIGSSRMDFRRLIPILDYFAARLGQSMSGKRQEGTNMSEEPRFPARRPGKRRLPPRPRRPRHRSRTPRLRPPHRQNLQPRRPSPTAKSRSRASRKRTGSAAKTAKELEATKAKLEAAEKKAE